LSEQEREKNKSERASLYLFTSLACGSSQAKVTNAHSRPALYAHFCLALSTPLFLPNAVFVDFGIFYVFVCCVFFLSDSLNQFFIFFSLLFDTFFSCALSDQFYFVVVSDQTFFSPRALGGKRVGFLIVEIGKQKS
jgi:hypothetical protein